MKTDRQKRFEDAIKVEFEETEKIPIPPIVEIIKDNLHPSENMQYSNKFIKFLFKKLWEKNQKIEKERDKAMHEINTAERKYLEQRKIVEGYKDMTEALVINTLGNIIGKMSDGNRRKELQDLWSRFISCENSIHGKKG